MKLFVHLCCSMLESHMAAVWHWHYEMLMCAQTLLNESSVLQQCMLYTRFNTCSNRMPLRLLQLIDDKYMPSASNATLQSG